MASWLQDLEDDWITDVQPTSGPPPLLPNTRLSHTIENTRSNPVFAKSMIPRPVAKKPSNSHKRAQTPPIAHGNTKQVVKSVKDETLEPTPILPSNPDRSPEGTVQKVNATSRPSIPRDAGNGDLFSPLGLESMFEQPLPDIEDVSRIDHHASLLGSRNTSRRTSVVEKEEQSDESNKLDSYYNHRLSRLTSSTSAENCSSITTGSPNPRVEQSQENSTSYSTLHRNPETFDSFGRSTWNSTPPPFVAWEHAKSSIQLNTSLFKDHASIASLRGGDYLNSISTSAFSDQSPGLNELLHVTSKSEFSKHIQDRRDAYQCDVEQPTPRVDDMDESERIYYATPDRQGLQQSEADDVSLQFSTIDQKDWLHLKLFSSHRNAFTRTTIHGRMSQLGLVNSPYKENSLSAEHQTETSFVNRSKRLLDGTPAGSLQSPQIYRSGEITPSRSLHPPSPVKESEAKRQKMSASFGAETIHSSENGDLSFDSDEVDSTSADLTVEECPSLNDTSELRGPNNRLLMEPEIDFSRSPHASFLSEPPSTFMRRQSLNSLNVILASRVKHMMPRKVGSMVFDEESHVWRHRQNSVEGSFHDPTMDKGVEAAEDENSLHSAEADDPFYEISDLTASPQAMGLENKDGRQKGKSYISSTGAHRPSSPTPEDLAELPRFKQSTNDIPNSKEPDHHGDDNGSSPDLNLRDFRKLSVSTDDSAHSTSNFVNQPGVRLVSPNFDPKKHKTMLRSEYSPSVAEKPGNTRLTNKSIALHKERPEVDATPNIATPSSISRDMDGNHHQTFHHRSTPQSLQQYTFSVQPNGRPPNRALLSIRKSELSFWNTPLTDISYHFLEGDSRMHSAFSRSYHPRHGKPSRKFTSDKGSLVVRNVVKHLTDNDMFGPYWDQNKALQIQEKGLEHLGDLASFHPNLVEVNLENNQLTHLTGMPVTVRDLKVAGNQISSLTAWNHLANLQFLDISRNKIEILSGLASLVHLRELKADKNQITSLEGILQLDGLVKLRLRHNIISVIDFSASNLKRLKTLDLGNNRIDNVNCLHHLPELSDLNLEANELSTLELVTGQEMRSLRALNVSKNKLKEFDILPFPNIRTLYLDANSLNTVLGIEKVCHLDSFSIRSQSQSTVLNLPFGMLLESRKVYASGNPISSLPIDCHFINLQYLELASCNIRTLTPNFGRLMSNIRILNLNNNAISDIRPLHGIVRLKKLYLVGNRLSNLQKISRVLRFLPFLSEMDLRHNPLTLGFYSVIPKCTTITIGSNSTADPSPFLMSHQNHDDDEAHHISMTDDTAVARRCYEILIGEHCPQITYLDGLVYDIQNKLRQDRIWERMASLGLLFDSKSKQDNLGPRLAASFVDQDEPFSTTIRHGGPPIAQE
ncbi:hypothetical protein TWF694_009982 [Orbilia ellipsospora]|uniref:Septation initiation network scaffold protein cdc11 n=1 Tax=Orbilia ellipsospora TaxID=2528407 RepID=A0AAV9XDH1_9PEZI